jgi:hypothetical protein
MRTGIDISQIVYEHTGVATYVRNLVKTLVESDPVGEYVLFGSSLRRRSAFWSFYNSLSCNKSRVKLRTFPFPPVFLEWLWNRMHVAPIEWFIGRVDVFWSSDWTQPPLAKARGVTTIHDLSIFKFPDSFSRKILTVQKRRLRRAKHECEAFLCDSMATQKDLIELLKINELKTKVVYPGFI